MQIVNGKEYRETSNTRLSRETVIKAARGSIKDRTGNLLVTTKMGFNIELYKTKINTGFFAMAFAYIIGAFFLDLKASNFRKQ